VKRANGGINDQGVFLDSGELAAAIAMYASAGGAAGQEHRTYLIVTVFEFCSV